MEVILRCLETVVGVLDHGDQLAVYHCNSDGNIIVTSNRVLDPVGISKVRFLLDEFLNRPLGFCAITSI